MSAHKNDPFRDFFRNVTLFRGQAMTLLDKTAQMDSLKKDFLPFYEESLHQLDEFFMNRFNLMDNSNIIQSLDLRPNSQKVYDEQEFQYPNLKKVKMSKCEYLQKVLESCKSQEENQRTVVLTNRSSLPLFDQKITVNLDTNKIHVEDDPNTFVYDISNEENMKAEEIDVTQQIIKVPVEIINNNNKATPRHSTQFNKENLITSPKALNAAAQVITLPASASAMVVRDMNVIQTACKDIQSTFDQLENSQTKKDELTKSLFQNFEQSENPNIKIGTALPSDDKAFSQEIEDLISSINTFQAPIVEEKVSVKKPSPEVKKSLINTMPSFFDAPNDARVSNPGKISTNKNPVHHAVSQETVIESYCTMPEPEADIPVEESDDEEYNLSEYSNDSENPVYRFHEKLESEEKPKHKKMFELYNKIQLNQANNEFGGLEKSSSLHEDSSSQLSGYENSNSNNTMVHDYNYYLKQQENKSGLPTFGGSFFDAMDKRMEQSPKKPVNKVKRLYCNDKRVPLWASNLEEVEKTSKAQKSVFDPNRIFGAFAVENLNLVEIFQHKSKRLMKARGSSANWRNDLTPPSNKKYLGSNEKSSHKKEFSGTKKVLEFKSSKKENFLRY